MESAALMVSFTTSPKFSISSSNFLNSRLPNTRHTQFSRRTRFGPGRSDGPTRLRFGAGYVKLSAVADAEPLSSDVIVLDVEGMMCEGCVSSVKRILETRSQVSSASVNLTSKSATIWPVSEAKVATSWQKDVGEALAKHLP